MWPLLGRTTRIALAMTLSSLAPSCRLPSSRSLALEINRVGVLQGQANVDSKHDSVNSDFYREQDWRV